jgi:hypothetical protein
MSPEAWLRGPVEGVPDVLQPIAHALLQARRTRATKAYRPSNSTHSPSRGGNPITAATSTIFSLTLRTDLGSWCDGKELTVEVLDYGVGTSGRQKGKPITVRASK